jgi:hypothetical protein
VLGSNTADGARVVVFECHGKANQRWRPRVENRFTWTDLEGGAAVVELWVDQQRPNVLVINDASGLVFRSEDGGESWSPLLEAPGFGQGEMVAMSCRSVQRAASGCWAVRRRVKRSTLRCVGIRNPRRSVFTCREIEVRAGGGSAAV